MVLEHIFPHRWLENKAEMAFFMGWGYSIVAIIIASLVFPSDPSLVAIGLTTIMLLPSMRKIITAKKIMIEEERKFSLKKLFGNNKDLVKIYLFMSLGIFLVHSTAAIILPAFQVNKIFEIQLAAKGISGAAVFPYGLFQVLLLNNFLVLIVCFLISLFTGDGGIFMITWNLSVWGTIFGVTARNAAIVASSDPFIFFLVIMLIVGPHAFLEIFSYILASISGGMISRGVRIEKFRSRKFRTLLYYNLALLVFAILFMFFGAFVESWVLGNITLYEKIIQMSLMV
jgi:hypothetical protein